MAGRSSLSRTVIPAGAGAEACQGGLDRSGLDQGGSPGQDQEADLGEGPGREGSQGQGAGPGGGQGPKVDQSQESQSQGRKVGWENLQGSPVPGAVL